MISLPFLVIGIVGIACGLMSWAVERFGLEIW